VSQISLQQTESVERMFQVSSSSVRLDPTTPLMSTDTVGRNERCDVMQCFLELGCDAQGIKPSHLHGSSSLGRLCLAGRIHACIRGDGSKAGRAPDISQPHHVMTRIQHRHA
jgi:hypothetical protein